jgi:hypothetical protein
MADWEAARAEHGDNVRPEHLARTSAQRHADALVAVFVAAATAPIDGLVPEPLVNIVIDQATFEEELARRAGAEVPVPDPAGYRNRMCRTTAGVAMTAVDAVAAAVVGQIRRVVTDGAGVVINLGRKQRLFTGAARDAVMLLTSGCRYAGCDQPPTRTQVDHIQEWADGGQTDTANGAPLCGRHNRFKTRTGYTTRRQPDGTWQTLRPDGTFTGRLRLTAGPTDG